MDPPAGRPGARPNSTAAPLWVDAGAPMRGAAVGRKTRGFITRAGQCSPLHRDPNHQISKTRTTTTAASHNTHTPPLCWTVARRNALALALHPTLPLSERPKCRAGGAFPSGIGLRGTDDTAIEARRVMQDGHVAAAVDRFVHSLASGCSALLAAPCSRTSALPDRWASTSSGTTATSSATARQS